MEELILKISNKKQLNIGGKVFEIDCNDARAIEALDQFAESQAETDHVSAEDLTTGCKETIDIVLGAGSYEALFAGLDHSVAPYYLCLDLVQIYKDEFLKDNKDKRAKEGAESLQSLREMAESMKVFNEALEKTSKRYGGAGRAMARQKRSASKRRN